MSDLKSGPNYTAADIGHFTDLITQGHVYKGKLFLKDLLNLTGMEVSLNILPAKKQVPFYHSHKENEELYIFLKGNGQFQVDGDTIDVTEGTVIRVGTEGIRTWRNNSNEDLYYIVIQAKQSTLTQSTIEDGIKNDEPVVWPK